MKRGGKANNNSGSNVNNKRDSKENNQNSSKRNNLNCTESNLGRKGNNLSSKGANLSYIIILIGISLSAALLLLQNPSITGGVAVQTISFLHEGEKFQFEVRDIPHVQEATVLIIQDTKNSRIILEEAAPPDSFNGHVLSAFKVSSEAENNFGRIDLELKIKRSDLASIPEKKLKVYLGETELATTISKKEGGYLYYSAGSPSLGIFVIGQRKPVEEVLPKEPEPTLSLLPEPKPAPVQKGFWSRLSEWTKNIFR